MVICLFVCFVEKLLRREEKNRRRRLRAMICMSVSIETSIVQSCFDIVCHNETRDAEQLHGVYIPSHREKLKKRTTYLSRA